MRLLHDLCRIAELVVRRFHHRRRAVHPPDLLREYLRAYNRPRIYMP
jgi:hypothetical protein